MTLAAEHLETARSFIPNLRILAGDVVRGGHPDAGGLQALHKAGVRTVVCLSGGSGLVGLFRSGGGPAENRETVQERAIAEKLGLKFVSIPMDVFGTVNQESLDQFIAVIGEQELRPLFLHCLHGRDRTGLMSAVYRLVVDGWTADKAYAEMIECGFDVGRTNLSDALFALAKRRAASEVGKG